MEVEKIHCTACGAVNLDSSNFCLRCGAELILPHPVQRDGGEIYTLPCSRCGSRLTVAILDGSVVCESCGLSHAVEVGEGYLALRPDAGASPASAEPIYCISCGKENIPGARFCMQCGKPIQRPAAPAGGTVAGNPERLECPYCGNSMLVAPDTAKLICTQCAAALSVERQGGQASLTVLKF
jgi:DNA-directed RNA polymerase subunit RPC12/RpoP